MIPTKILSIYEPAAREFLELSAKKNAVPPGYLDEHAEIREDFSLSSNKYPIFAVGDGVTLIQYIYENKPYPNPSPAGEVARIFFESIIAAAERKYETLDENDLREIFSEANNRVAEYNKSQGRTKESSDYWMNDLFAATGAFVVRKENKIFWASICDSYVAKLEEGKVVFKSPECNSKKEADGIEYSGDKNDPKEKAKFTWKERRNGVNSEGKLTGYGVITGEENANKYLSTGSVEIQEGEQVAIFTDGFEEYFNDAKFLSLISNPSNNLENEIKNLSKEMIKLDPEKFGHERSLIIFSA